MEGQTGTIVRKGYGQFIEDFYFEFTAPGAATSVAQTVIFGSTMITIAHGAGTNICTVTVAGKIPKVIGIFPELRNVSGGATNHKVTVSDITNEGSSTANLTFALNFFDTNNAVINDATDVCMVHVVFKNSGLTTASSR